MCLEKKKILLKYLFFLFLKRKLKLKYICVNLKYLN